MKLENLVKGLKIEHICGNLNIDINGISYDSRKVSNGDIFVAIKGFKVDGHKFINHAIDKGAVACIIEDDINFDCDITLIKVEDTRYALAKLSSNFYNEPSKKIQMIGVTGTNGKTTITYLLKSIFESNNKKTGVIGTIGNIVNDKITKTNNTTPESLLVQQNLYDMLKYNTEYCFMEVSSHSLALKRVECCNFDVGIFTNLSREHLDYHNTLENYFKSKLKLFYKTSKCNVINIDDGYGKKIINKLSELKVPTITYGIKEKSDIYATDIKYHLEGVEFLLNTPKGSIEINLNIPGEFSVYNALAAAGCAYFYNVSLEGIKKGLETIKGVKGRFEIVSTGRDFTVIIDFAHTPDGLEKVLTTIDQFAEGRKITVFGAGGNRDKTKRPIMGETVAKHSDLCVVTSDNPRNENPKSIIEDVIEGVKREKGNYVAIVDRKEAIRYALENAKPKDIILLAGKGHETYVIIKDEILPFDERKIVMDILKDMK